MDTTQEVGKNSDSNIRLVHPGALPLVWDNVLKVMREYPRGLFDGYFSEDEVLQALTMNRYDLWVGVDPNGDEFNFECVALCRLERYQAFSVYRIMWAGGQVGKHLHDAMFQLDFYATSVLNANSLALDGRVGWTRVLDKYGFTPQRIELHKPLGRRH